MSGKVSRNKLVQKHKLENEINSVIQAEITKDNCDQLINKVKVFLKGRKLDGIIGGPPCQAYSNIGRARDKNGMKDDKRNYLYEFYLKFIEELKPKFFIFENVPGLMNAGKGIYLKNILNGVRKLGYSIPDPTIINAADYGVPQNRKRVIMLGWKPTMNIQTEKIFSKVKKMNCTVENFLDDLPKLKPGEERNNVKYIKDSAILQKNGIRCKQDRVFSHTSRPHNGRDLDIYKIAIKKYRKGQKLRYNELPKELKTHNNEKSFLDRFKVIDMKATASHTIVAHISKDGHYYIHPKQNRSLSVREAARLQTFPDNYKFEGSRTAQFKQIGNAVPPILSTILAIGLKQYFK